MAGLVSPAVLNNDIKYEGLQGLAQLRRIPFLGRSRIEEIGRAGLPMYEPSPSLRLSHKPESVRLPHSLAEAPGAAELPTAVSVGEASTRHVG